MDYNYTLIISQYYYSRHMFIVKYNERFLEKAKDFAKELITYKRDRDCTRELCLGDLDYGDPNVVRPRYNINDSGDIYFIHAKYANYCKDVSIEYREDSIRESRGYQSKKITNSICDHHDYHRVKEIVERHFEIA